MDDLDQLYQDLILDHYKHPRNKSDLTDDQVLIEEDNPLCGDHIRLTATVEEGRITDIRFDGHGCAISQASASMMTETLKGKTVVEALDVIRGFVAAMRGEADFPSDTADDLMALSGVKKFPLRVKCATLSWRGMQRIMDQWAD